MSDETRIGDRFSAQEFARRGLDSDDAALLALDLEQAVGQKIFARLKEAAEAVVRELNEQGHSLALDDEQIGDPMLPIGISYRDETLGALGTDVPRCKLRLAFDLTVSAGYAHLSDELEEARAQVALRRCD
jgi:hypothetical protein